MKLMSTAFDLDAFLPYRLSVASNLVSRLFARRYAEEFGLTIAEWRVIAVLGADGTATASAVRARTGMDKAKVSRAVAGLEARGLIRHVAHRGDRRLDPLALSAAGRRILDAIVPRARALETELFAALPPGTREAMETALRAIADRATVMGAGPGDGPD
ncbi:winged helix-turn-helix transcriptional regulator [Roseomonas oryzicola]|uniref:Winged helix-turn-helix transcriptional regulator n=2 Tax=Neoroseomonas oryzicola TaxID=535904 RepID=A0A9X9WIW8_9PROT|nr:winged helix-turn-helix transcriptional regulator [Neoroseomonas oryzicola]NKE18035.1 winged helix-turn-helix transcriptional regulator [Neoroseomonas oryzicola]